MATDSKFWALIFLNIAHNAFPVLRKHIHCPDIQANRHTPLEREKGKGLSEWAPWRLAIHVYKVIYAEGSTVQVTGLDTF